MNKWIIVCATFALAAGVFATRPLRSAPQDGGKLQAAMEEIGGAVKSIQTALKTPDTVEKALPEVWKAQRATLDAKAELPKLVADLADEKAKRKAELAYRTQMQDLMRAFLDVEAAILAGDAKKADKALRQADNLKSAGHSQFRPRDGR